MELLELIFDIICDGWWILLLVGVSLALFLNAIREEREYEPLNKYYHLYDEDAKKESDNI